MSEETNEDREGHQEPALADDDRFLAEMARSNQDLEAQYGGEESLGKGRPMSLWERIKQAISVLASTGPTR